MDAFISVEMRGGVAIVTVDNPPVNALSHRVRAPLARMMAQLDDDAAVRAIVLAFAGANFCAGADIAELGAAPLAPSMGEVMRRIDAARPVLVAAIQGQALGGGLELALLCDWRVATSAARFGLPEIKLGLMPGGGGTQRLPRLIGVGPAIDMIVSGQPMAAPEALACGLIDEIAQGSLLDAAVEMAERAVAGTVGQRRLSRRTLTTNGLDFAARRVQAVASTGLEAGGWAVDAVAAAAGPDFAAGLAQEAILFQRCRASAESAALRHLFAAERSVGRLPSGVAPRAVAQVAVIGAGTMGTGVAAALLDGGYDVVLADTTQAGIDRGIAAIASIYASQVARGRLTQPAADGRLGRLHPTLRLEDAAPADLVIECVFEDMTVKQTLFARLGAIAAPHAVLATNTSALDANAIASASGRPADVVGMHFFSPAHIMKLVEVVQAAHTAPDVLATALSVVRKLGKIGVVAGVCDGFIGNRMVGGYLRQANLLLLEGCEPAQVDGALRRFGMAMGPHAMGDMAGLDIQAAARARRRAEGRLSADDPSGNIGDRLVEAGRLGVKSGRGLYRYEAGSRTALPDADADALIAAESRRLGIVRRPFTDDEIVARCITPLINEGCRILEEGVARAAADIDVVYCNGYGFPRTRGGPMFHADTIGLAEVLRAIEGYRDTLDARQWQPAPLLSRLAGKGMRLADHRHAA